MPEKAWLLNSTGQIVQTFDLDQSTITHELKIDKEVSSGIYSVQISGSANETRTGHYFEIDFAEIDYVCNCL